MAAATAAAARLSLQSTASLTSGAAILRREYSTATTSATPLQQQQHARRIQVTCIAASDVASPATSERQLWLPGSTPPSYLDGSLPGDVGFDPLGLGEDSEALRWYVQAELVHCRWAMLGVAGVLFTDVLRVSGLVSTLPVWYEAGAQEYSIASTPTLFAIQMLLFNFVELKRWADFKSPGSQGDYEKAFFFFIEPALGGVANGYPGGPLFDPLGFGAEESHPLTRQRKEQEIANGRLAMVAFLGFAVQAKITGAGPVDNLLKHLADPWHTTVIDTIAGLQ